MSDQRSTDSIFSGSLLFLLSVSLIIHAGCDNSPTDSANTSPAESRVSQVTDAKNEVSRSFQLTYGASLKELSPGQKVRVWIPKPQTGPHQEITELEASHPPTAKGMSDGKDEKFGNAIHYFEATASDTGDLSFEFKYDVVRKEADSYGKGQPLTEQEQKHFTGANSLVPIDGKPVELLKDIELPGEDVATAERLYQLVFDHMKYDKSKPGYGTGNSVWACDSRFGNCTDFHSLFISLARSQTIPSKFEIGFPLPPVNEKQDNLSGKIGGYHCWAWFHSKEDGWKPVDISEADKHPEMKEYYFGSLTADRVAFSTGRDIELVPQSASGPLNYFVYPHVEVDGEVWPKEKIELDFRYGTAN